VRNCCAALNQPVAWSTEKLIQQPKVRNGCAALNRSVEFFIA
jgi:hypothetical protein